MKGVTSTGETIQLFRLDTIAPSTQRTKSKDRVHDAQDRLFFSKKSSPKIAWMCCGCFLHGMPRRTKSGSWAAKNHNETKKVKNRRLLPVVSPRCVSGVMRSDGSFALDLAGGLAIP